MRGFILIWSINRVNRLFGRLDLSAESSHIRFYCFNVYFSVGFNLLSSFTMPKVFYCSKCALQYPRPVGRKCQYEGESLAGDVEVVAPSSTDPASVATVSDQIFLQLQRLGEKMDSMEATADRGRTRTMNTTGKFFV